MVDFVPMGTEKRARQKANRAARLAEVEVEEVKEQREESVRKWGRIAAVVGGIIALFVIWSLLTGGGDEDATIEFEDSQDEAAGPAPVEEVVLATEVPADFVPFSGERALALVEPQARDGVYTEAPPMTIDPEASYAAVINTSVGPIRLNLFADEAPIAVNNFVNLAEDGFYDGIAFHRVIEDFMAQGGDPTGTGSGGPGYTFEDEVDTGRIFDDRGILAMANSGPATNGSQFFITFAPTDWLNGLHTIFGEISGDGAILDQIPDSGTGDEVLIESISILAG